MTFWVRALSMAVGVTPTLLVFATPYWGLSLSFRHGVHWYRFNKGGWRKLQPGRAIGRAWFLLG